ncbi:putative FAD binding molybdopterin dehydrogenase [Escherichia coli]|uniref:Putative FAD binding molybdopterin dehydrogenase n=1 Tax=Escherichia coli TaxID=562 RepID=A0A376REV3_ECOLX|nr:putative FAD binding molybdopterin dehydrogenase [Escherichia coli]
MSRLQPLRDARFIPAALREALGFVYSRHVRNQSTIGGEIAARQEESVLLPVLLALDAELVFGNGETLSIEDYLASPCDRLLTEIIIKDPYRTCATRKISRSQAGLTVVTAAVAMTDHDGMRIALDGVASKHCVCTMSKNKIWKAMHLNRLSPTPFSRRKICGAAWPINAISREFW